MVLQSIGMLVFLAAILFGTFQQHRRNGTWNGGGRFHLFRYLNIQTGDRIDDTLCDATIATAIATAAAIAVVAIERWRRTLVL